MDASRRSQRTKDGEGTKAKVTKCCGKQPKEKPALSPIEEETDSPDSSGDSAINFRGIEPEASAKNHPYDLRVSLREDYEEVLRDTEDAGEEGKQQPETPPFLTARNGSDHEAGSKSGDSNSTTTSYERSTPDDDDDDDDDESSFPGESSCEDGDYRCNSDHQVADLERDLEQHDESASPPESRRKTKESRPKSAPGCAGIESLDSNREERLCELSTTVEWLKARLVMAERDVYCLRKQFGLEKSRNRKLAKRCEEDRDVTREALRIDLEVWIKKLNDALKGYLAEWQKRERLRLNEEIWRIGELYSQEIAKSLEASLEEWRSEESKKVIELMDERDRSFQDKERAGATAVYEKIQSHLENLEKRNRKSYAGFRKQIDKWEERLREEVAKLREEDLKKLRQQLDNWREEERTKAPERGLKKERTPERCTEKEGCSFPGAESLIHVEERLMERLRDSSSKDLRRTERIVRTELKAQRRELAKRMNERLAELWMALEEFGSASGGGVDRARPRRPSSGLSAAAARNDLEDPRELAASLTKDAVLNPDVFGGRRVGGKIYARAARADGSTGSGTDVEDGDRDYREDDDDDDDDDDAESPLEENSGKQLQERPRTWSASSNSASTKNSTSPDRPTDVASNRTSGFSLGARTRK